MFDDLAKQFIPDQGQWNIFVRDEGVFFEG